MGNSSCDKKRKRLLIVCGHPLEEHPNAIRMLNFGKMVKDELEVEALGISYDNKAAKKYVIDGISCEQVSLNTDTSISAKLKKTRILKKTINEYLEKIEKPDYILMAQPYFNTFQRYIGKFAKKNSCVIIQSVCEWYDKNDAMFKGLTGKIKLILNRFQLMFYNVKCKNTVCISELLQDYYVKKKCHSMLITTTVDLSEFIYKSKEKEDKDYISVMYAGSPKKKDYLGNSLLGMANLTEDELKKIKFDIYGATKEQVEELLGKEKECLKYIKDSVIFHGRVPHSEIADALKTADFTVLLRPNMRYANAGFPTKVGESMAMGVPVLANLTSDLGKYIVEKQTGMICKSESPEAFADCLKRTISLGRDEINIMKENARKTAEKYFDYSVYNKKFLEFLNECER